MEELDIAPLVKTFSEFFERYYGDKINHLSLQYPTRRSLFVDYRDLERIEPELADELIKNPESTVRAAEDAIREMNLQISTGEKFEPHVRFTNVFIAETLIENLRSKNINELVSFKGVVTRRAEVMHKVKVAVYKCRLCEEEMEVFVGRDFTPPKRCRSCKKFNCLKQINDRCEFVDIQKAEIQELLERVRGGAPAAHIQLLFEDDLVNEIAPGDNIEIVGTLRLQPPAKTKNKSGIIFSRYVKVNSITSLKKDFEEIEITPEDERRIKDLSKDPRICEYLEKSVAPAIYGHDEVKRALCLQIFGGTAGKIMKGGAKIRNDIHILLIGDPGIAKSRFLLSVNELAPKSIYVSGKTTSGAGLTVTAEKDELGDGGWTLKAGALVLASGGCTQIDEFDKIDDEDRAAMHEAMETQSISVAKAGIIAKFRTKTSVLAAANPKWGRFDQTKNLAEQFNIPPTLLSRFDLIFPIVDILDEEKDSKLAEHILSTHRGEMEHDEAYLIEKDLLRKYISYSRRKINPKLTKEASEKIREFYIDLRSKSRDSGSVAITPRYLEGLVRLAEARAKMRLSKTVDSYDAEISIGLMNYVMRQVMTDQETGMLDIDVVTTGKPKSKREKLQKSDTIMDIIREHLRDHDTANMEEIIQDAKSYDIKEGDARRIMDEFLRRGKIYEKEHGQIKIVGGR